MAQFNERVGGPRLDEHTRHFLQRKKNDNGWLPGELEGVYDKLVNVFLFYKACLRESSKIMGIFELLILSIINQWTEPFLVVEVPSILYPPSIESMIITNPSSLHLCLYQSIEIIVVKVTGTLLLYLEFQCNDGNYFIKFYCI